MSTRLSVLAVLIAAFIGGLGLSLFMAMRGAAGPDPEQLVARPKRVITPLHTELQPDEIASFTEFPLYWLGEEYQGMRLRRIIRHVSPLTVERPENSVLFIYGTCDASADGGCSPPLSIRVEPYCYTRPESIYPGANQSDMIKIRGAADARVVSDGVRIWTGAVTVRIADDTRLTDAEMAAAEALSSPNSAQAPSAGDDLAAPETDCSDFTFEMAPSLQ